MGADVMNSRSIGRIAVQAVPFLVLSGLLLAGVGCLLQVGHMSPPTAPGPAADAGPPSYTVSPAWDPHRLRSLEAQVLELRRRLDKLDGGDQ
jgi:hypothetical protein